MTNNHFFFVVSLTGELPGELLDALDGVLEIANPSGFDEFLVPVYHAPSLPLGVARELGDEDARVVQIDLRLAEEVVGGEDRGV